MVGPGLATGDIDGDGRDEIVVTGIKNEITSEANKNRAKRKNAYSITDKRLRPSYAAQTARIPPPPSNITSWTPTAGPKTVL